MVREIVRGWRRFKRAHADAIEFVGDLLAGIGVFVFIIELYFFMVIIGG